jgi:hypothetical protein
MRCLSQLGQKDMKIAAAPRVSAKQSTTAESSDLTTDGEEMSAGYTTTGSSTTTSSMQVHPIAYFACVRCSSPLMSAVIMLCLIE